MICADLTHLHIPVTDLSVYIEAYTDTKERASRLVTYLMTVPVSRDLAVLGDLDAMLQLATTLKSKDGILIMSADGPDASALRYYVKDYLETEFEERHYIAECLNGKDKLLEKTARNIMSLAQMEDLYGTNLPRMAWIHCAACVSHAPFDDKGHDAEAGCILNRSVDIIDKYFETAIKAVLISRPSYYYGEERINETHLKDAKESLRVAWKYYAPKLGSIPFWQCPACCRRGV